MIKKVLSKLGLGLLYLLSLLPFSALYAIADVVYLLLARVIRYRRKVIHENLLNAFPEKSEQERRDIQQRYYRYMADLLVETVKLFSISQKEVARRVRVINPELIQQAFAEGKSVIGVLGHYGNWEMGALRFSQLYDQPRIIVYKPLSNRVFNRAIYKMRSRFGATLVSMKSTLRKLVELKNQPTVTVMVCDQTPPKPEIQYFTNFLNQSTAVFLGAEKLAKYTDSVVVFCDIRRERRGYYSCKFVPLFDHPQETQGHEITDTHVHYLEEVIRQEPELWLWSHRRWKFKPEDVGYAAQEPDAHILAHAC